MGFNQNRIVIVLIRLSFNWIWSRPHWNWIVDNSIPEPKLPKAYSVWYKLTEWPTRKWWKYNDHFNPAKSENNYSSYMIFRLCTRIYWQSKTGWEELFFVPNCLNEFAKRPSFLKNHGVLRERFCLWLNEAWIINLAVCLRVCQCRMINLKLGNVRLTKRLSLTCILPFFLCVWPWTLYNVDQGSIS